MVTYLDDYEFNLLTECYNWNLLGFKLTPAQLAFMVRHNPLWPRGTRSIRLMLIKMLTNIGCLERVGNGLQITHKGCNVINRKHPSECSYAVKN